VIVRSGDLSPGNMISMTFFAKLFSEVSVATGCPFGRGGADILELLGRSCTRHTIHRRDLCWFLASYVRAFSSHQNISLKRIPIHWLDRLGRSDVTSLKMSSHRSNHHESSTRTCGAFPESPSKA
jgi:hypothetical protein